MNHVCPQCQYNDMIQKVSAIYQAGTTHSTHNASGSYAGSTTSQTTLASHCAPPSEKFGVIITAFFWMFFGLIPEFFIWAAISDSIKKGDKSWWITALHNAGNLLDKITGSNAGLFILVVLIFGLVSLPFGIRNAIWNSTVFPSLLQNWRNRWYCHRCNVFFVSNSQ